MIFLDAYFFMLGSYNRYTHTIFCGYQSISTLFYSFSMNIHSEP